ncbi:hypothetical protein QVD17_19641 [Tagetes erecta]|uniref:Uncharacterized protein n=1 Tax=Tagetes erecta TaxID=13708 RepID=A0AAD8KKA2_TARER|nr:hypothetical protein QVD17_19641 [Tagetes erecta]
MVRQLVSERGNKNKTGHGFTYEPMPESITNTLPENINTHDQSPENEAKLKEFLRKKSDSESHVEKTDVEIYIETDCWEPLIPKELYQSKPESESESSNEEDNDDVHDADMNMVEEMNVSEETASHHTEEVDDNLMFDVDVLDDTFIDVAHTVKMSI